MNWSGFSENGSLGDRFEGTTTNDSISSSRESSDSPGLDVVTDICKPLPLDTSNQMPMENKVPGDDVFAILEHFSQTKSYNKTDWLPLTVLETAEKEKEELWASNSQHKICINHFKAFTSSLKETLVYCSCAAEISENRTQSFILQLNELQCKLNSQILRVSSTKVRALVRKDKI